MKKLALPHLRDRPSRATRFRGIPALFISFALTAGGLLGGCQLLAPPKENESTPDLMFLKLELESYKHGKLEARGQFEELQHYTASQMAKGEQVRWRPVNRAGEEEGVLEAGQGDAELKRSKAVLRQGVEYRSAEGLRLESASAHIDFSERSARSDEETLIESDELRSIGDTFSARSGPDGWLRLEGNVRTVLNPSADSEAVQDAGEEFAGESVAGSGEGASEGSVEGSVERAVEGALGGSVEGSAEESQGPAVGAGKKEGGLE